MNSIYKHSNTTASLWFVGFPLMLIAAPILALAYAALDRYNPIIYLTFLGLFGMYLAFTFLFEKAAKLSHCRNAKAVVFMGVIVGLWTLYCSWVCFVWILSEYEHFLLTKPQTLWEVMNALAEEGLWSIGRGSSENVTGILLQIVWVVEALIIMAAAIFSSMSALNNEVYCEACGYWNKNLKTKHKAGLRLSSTQDVELTRQALTEDINLLAQLPYAESYENPHMLIRTTLCPRCQKHATASIFKVSYVKKDEKEEVKIKQITAPIILSKEGINAMQQKTAEMPSDRNF
ncbi:MAG: hypothetical protein ACK5IJ_10230 [Mangrovibacterium sp.]